MKNFMCDWNVFCTFSKAAVDADVASVRFEMLNILRRLNWKLNTLAAADAETQKNIAHI